MKKRGISPIVATVLLIAMVVVLGLIIFMWFRGFTQESITKFEQSIELSCDKISFDANYASGILSIINTGNVPIYRIELKIVEQGAYSTRELKDTDNWDEKGLNQGGTFISSDLNLNNPNEIILIPVLIGDTQSGGQKKYKCDEELYGYPLTL
ncbi:archaellin/type IV pilin N-terminal domain-containing protein [Nanoarchaeota archaeon]